MLRDNSINKRLKTLRLEKNYTQLKMSELLGIKVSTYSQMERKGLIPSTTLKNICEILNVSADFLLCGKITSSQNTDNLSFERLSGALIKALEEKNHNRYGFFNNVNETELKMLRIVFCLNKKQRIAVYEYANKILKKEINI